MLGKARDDVQVFQSSYLTKFIDEQISLHSEERDAQLDSNARLNERIKNIFLKAMA